MGADLIAAKEILLEATKEEKISKKKKEHPLLSEFARNLSELAERGIFDNLIGRETEIERIIQILSRRRKNNPILLGEAGVGKTAIVEGLAQRIYEGNVPPSLADKRIYALDLCTLSLPLFFSYRRDKSTGRQASLIWIKEA